ncbi:EpsG family protein [Dysgonomonas sp. 520]|uniref:EpsG family protein n=1 Tax=Dysgonomonas sp. 520 TaxID=2302931 RepID=UPI0013D656B8|nr:EpsG family protein [Dysgonomonas sp. 520]NDW08961.1 EpsG family protein [Dysgonomonas sp. 520]
MEELYFIQSYYYVLLGVLLLTPCAILITYTSKDKSQSYIPSIFIAALFVIYTTIYIAAREVNIGYDTKMYYETFYGTARVNKFYFSRDFLFDFFIFIFSRSFDFFVFLLFCSVVYNIIAAISFYKIFHKYVIFALLIFFISPNFFLYGINGIRSGMAASIFLLGLAMYYKKSKGYFILFILSCATHLSMLAPTLAFIASKYVKTTKILLYIWSFFLLLAIVGIDSGISSIISLGGLLSSRATSYIDATNTISGNWFTYFTFSIIPILIGIYFVIYKKNKDVFYIQILNMYLMINTLYLILFTTQFAVRFSYLSEFLAPILIIYPFVYCSDWKYRYLKLSIIFIPVFLIKAYKIFIL